MKLGFRSLSVRCASAVMAVIAGTCPLQARGIAPGVQCVIPNLWRQDPVVQTAALSTGAPLIRTDERSGSVQVLPTVGSWSLRYLGTGYDRMRGVARQRVARGGVLWAVSASDLGVPAVAAARALLQAGAVVARPQADGTVVFRAREAVAERIASAAARRLAPGEPRAATFQNASFQRGFAVSRGAERGTANLALSGGVKAEVAMLRLEGRLSKSAAGFIEQLPTPSMTVYPFGTSFVVHVPPTDMEALRYFIEDQGNSVVLVGATGPLAPGTGAGDAIRSCGGNVLADRFPTPAVGAVGGGTARIDVEGQSLEVSAGDVLLVVQPPAFGGGLEIALMRFSR